MTNPDWKDTALAAYTEQQANTRRAVQAAMYRAVLALQLPLTLEQMDPDAPRYPVDGETFVLAYGPIDWGLFKGAPWSVSWYIHLERPCTVCGAAVRSGQIGTPVDLGRVLTTWQPVCLLHQEGATP